MKDAKGHGSDSRGGSGGTPGFGSHVLKYRGPNVAEPTAMKTSLSRGTLSPGYAKEDNARTISDLRARMSGTGPGHATGLLQGIKNLLGGSQSAAPPSGYTGFGKRGLHG